QSTAIGRSRPNTSTWTLATMRPALGLATSSRRATPLAWWNPSTCAPTQRVQLPGRCARALRTRSSAWVSIIVSDIRTRLRIVEPRLGAGPFAFGIVAACTSRFVVMRSSQGNACDQFLDGSLRQIEPRHFPAYALEVHADCGLSRVVQHDLQLHGILWPQP